MDISVVVPLYNEEESLPDLFAGIERVMNANGFSYEVIFVNDGSTDRSWQVIEQLQAQAPDKVRGIKFRRNYGKSPALFCGFDQAQGDVVITMDADLQDRNVTTRCRRPSPPNCSMPPPAKYRASKTCTTLIAD